MNQWEIYSRNTVTNGIGYQESFNFDYQVETVSTPNPKTLLSVLPTRGWPNAELSQVSCNNVKSTLQLLLPTLAQLNAQNRWITLISPPADINQTLFSQYGIDTSRVLLIHPKNDVDDKVTMNKALKNGTSGIVIFWTSQLNKRFLAQWRKSVKQGNSSGIIINSSRKTCDSSSIALSFSVSSKKNSLLVNRIKLFGVQHIQDKEILFSKSDLDAVLDENNSRDYQNIIN